MKFIESKLTREGFQKLQEKEDMIYFDKTIDFGDSSTQQICLVYDKLTRKVKSVDTYILSDGNMQLTDSNETKKHIYKLLSS